VPTSAPSSDPPEAARPKKLLRAFFALVVLVAVGAVVVPVLFYADPRTVEALEVDGIPLAQTTDPAAALREQAERWLDAPVTVDAHLVVTSRPRRALGASIDLEATVERIERLGRTGDPVADVEARFSDEAANVPFVVEIDEGTARRFVQTLRDESALATPRSNDPNAREALTLPLLESVALLSDGLRASASYITLPTRRVAAPELPEIVIEEFGEVLASHRTEYRNVQRGRQRNIERAAELIDGLVIEPGAEFSFNEAVGNRTIERGFRQATEIMNGDLVDGIGGGVCQTAGTLHAAAYMAGLEITEHHHHSRESEYIDLGLDAMVTWQDNDLRFKNDLPFRVRIWALARDGALEVQIRGRERTRTVTYRSVPLDRTDHREECVPAPDLSFGAEEVMREGRDGVILERTRVIIDRDGERNDVDRISYPPLNRFVRRGGQC
jgi:hypothetical protein